MGNNVSQKQISSPGLEAKSLDSSASLAVCSFGFTKLNHERARDSQDLKYVIDRSLTLPAIEVRAKELEQSCIETKELDTILGNFIMHRSIYRISLLAFVPGTMFGNRSRLDCIFCFCSDRPPKAAIAILRGRRPSRLNVPTFGSLGVCVTKTTSIVEIGKFNMRGL